jgi:hypothetical protein
MKSLLSSTPIYFEDHGDTRKLHWMTEDQWCEVSYAQFARLLGFGRKDASRVRIHMALKLDARKIKFMYPRIKQGNFGETTDMLPFVGGHKMHIFTTNISTFHARYRR